MPGIESYGRGTPRVTPIIRNFPTEAGAKAHAERYSVNAQCEGRRSPTGGFTPVAVLRPDQVFQRARIEEQGVLVELAAMGERVISDEMERVGAAYLRDAFGQLHEGVNWRLIAHQVYAEMERAR
jgi:hypothetical protein